MKALQVVSRGEVEFVDAEKPRLKPGHALVRPRMLGLCGSDIWMLDFCPEERYPCPVGTTGHEVIAEVVAIDGEHDSVKVGDLTLALTPDHRGMAEYYLAPLENLLPLPAGKSPEELLMAQQLGTVIFASKYLPNVIGKTVAVVGQGSAGLWFNAMLKRYGAGKVISFDNHEHRMALSERYGADHVIHGSADDAVESLKSVNCGELADIVVEAAGRESSINLSFQLAKDNEGFLLQFGLPRPPIHVDYASMFWQRLTVKSIVHAATEKGHTSTLHALDLIGSGALDVQPVLTHRFPFERVREAFDLQRTAADGAVKTIVDIPG
ncbi:MAG: zinc-binding dehydrogenase [Planctomycetota bacterium]|nr:zinc-binding dehydrogenase [Planctomycetota bacterium]